MGRAIGIANAIGFRVGSKVNQKFAFATADGSQALSITVRLPVGKTLKVNWGDGTSNEYTGAGASNVTLSKTYAGAGTYPITFEKDFTALTYLLCSDNSLSGDVSGWSKLTNLDFLNCRDNSLSGDVSSWSALTSLTMLLCYNNNLSGDVSSWSALTGLTQLICHTNSLTGDVSSWSALTSLTLLICHSNSLTGDVSSWSSLTTLSELNCRQNDLSGFVPSVSVVNYFAYQNNFSGSNQTVFKTNMLNFNISNQKVVFPTSEIDKLLLNLANYYEVNAPTSDCTINMSGANMGIPTGGSSNADLTRLVGYYTAAGRTCNVLIRTS